MSYCGKCDIELLEDVHARFNGLCPKCAWFAQLEMTLEEAFEEFRPKIEAYSKGYDQIFRCLFGVVT